MEFLCINDRRNKEIIKSLLLAKIARETGFTGIQIHSAHGYCSQNFIPDINLREDEWVKQLKIDQEFMSK